MAAKAINEVRGRAKATLAQAAQVNGLLHPAF